VIKYIIKRILWLIPVLLGVAILIFSIMYFVPGDPVEIIMGSGATAAEKEVVREQLGLNQPYIKRLLDFLGKFFLHFDLGKSYIDGVPVMQSLLQRLPRTLVITMGSTILAIILGIPLGIISAMKHDKPLDSFSVLVALVGVSMPHFWLAMLLILLFALKLHWLPSFGIGSWQSYVLPCIASCFGILANLARQSRSSMLEVIQSDYITTARSKGVSQFGVICFHALPNALIPIVTVIGTRLASGVAGSLILESVFSIPGIGLYMITAINQRDYPAIQGSIVFTSFLFGIIILIVDLIYAAIDPRIKARYTSGSRRKKGDAVLSKGDPVNA
jgi:peptide/nickel transport system permease protein